VRRALVALDKEGCLRYEPPFRGRGIEKLVSDPPPFKSVPIDWARQTARRRIEEARLERMEEYMRHRGCRREFILRYFGERTALKCGMCDCCAQAAPAAEEAKGGVLAREGAIARAALTAVRHLRWPVGALFVADILKGSRREQIVRGGHDRNPAYGTVSAKRETVKRVLDELVREGYLGVDGEAGRPVLALTERGEAAVEDGWELPSAVTPESATKAPVSRDEDVERSIMECVEGLPAAVGIGKVVEVVTGSKAAWILHAGLMTMPFYGRVAAKREGVREVIGKMIGRGLLKRSGDRQYPVLELTPAGEAVLRGRQEEPVTISQPPPEAPAERPQVPSTVTERESPAKLLDALIAELLLSDRERAPRLLEELRLFHPREVSARLALQLESAPDEVVQGRIAWMLGETGEKHALASLLVCAGSPHASVRRLTASALRKLIESGCVPATNDAVREALERLNRDAVAQVRQYAAKALALMRDP
jgi:superfamily II DNA helicase RecQ